MSDKVRCCENFAPIFGDFKKVADLHYSGLTIYLHSQKDDQKKMVYAKHADTIVLYNSSTKELKRTDYFRELCRYKTKCNQCRSIIQWVRSLLDEIVAIKGNQVIGICEHCKRATAAEQCKRCNYIVSKFLAGQEKRKEERHKRFKEWLIKVREFLLAILNAHTVCQHTVYKDIELERILKELKEPLSMRIPDTDVFPNTQDDFFITQSITESKDMLEELLNRIQSESLNKRESLDDSLLSTPSTYKGTCICKLLKEGQLLEREISTISADGKMPISIADLEKNLGSQALFRDILQKLIDLGKGLTQRAFKHVSKDLLQKYLNTLSYAIKHGLLSDVTKKLLEELTEFSEVLTDKDGPYKKNTIDLIAELNKCLTSGGEKQIIHVLANVCKEIGQEVDKDIQKDAQKDTQKDAQKAAPKSPQKDAKKDAQDDAQKDTEQDAQKDTQQEAQRDTQKESKKTSVKDASRGSPREPISKIDKNSLVDKLLELNKALIKGLSQALDKELIQELSTNLKNDIMKDPDHLYKAAIEELTETCKIVAKGVPKNVNNEHVQELVGAINKVLQQDLAVEKNKHSLQTNLKELNKILAQALSKDKSAAGETNKKQIKGESLSTKEKKSKTKLGKEGKSGKDGIDDTDEKDGKKGKAGKTGKDDKDGKGGKDGKDGADDADGKKGKGGKSDTEGKDGKEGKEEKESKPRKPTKEEALELAKEKQLREAALKEAKEARLAKQAEKAASQKALLEKQSKSNVKKRLSKGRFSKQSRLFDGSLKSRDDSDFLQGETFVECHVESDSPKYIVKGTSVKTYHPQHKEEQPFEGQPAILFRKDIAFKEYEETVQSTGKVKSKSDKVREEPVDLRGIVRYRLSDKEFIDKGWTKLPTMKIMRKMNIYRMLPSNPKYDWFERHRTHGVLFYDTGEKLAQVDHETGRGSWYYRNGAMALEYYDTQGEETSGQRYVVYSSGDEVEDGKQKPRTVLALFDYLGNGIVYDVNGNVRLKYNQSEGILIDSKIGPPGRWKWHSLNDPPCLQQVFVNAYLPARDPSIEKLGPSKEPEKDLLTKQAQADMLQIELDNYVKLKAEKMVQKFKPFQIRMKAAKLNEHFSLKILEQSNITLIYRDGSTNLKLNLGMDLISHEIIDSDVSEVSDVATPYDKHPPKSDSVANIQNTLNYIRKLNKTNKASEY